MVSSQVNLAVLLSTLGCAKHSMLRSKGTWHREAAVAGTLTLAVTLEINPNPNPSANPQVRVFFVHLITSLYTQSDILFGYVGEGAMHRYALEAISNHDHLHQCMIACLSHVLHARCGLTR